MWLAASAAAFLQPRHSILPSSIGYTAASRSSALLLAGPRVDNGHPSDFRQLPTARKLRGIMLHSTTPHQETGKHDNQPFRDESAARSPSLPNESSHSIDAAFETKPSSCPESPRGRMKRSVNMVTRIGEMQMVSGDQAEQSGSDEKANEDGAEDVHDAAGAASPADIRHMGRDPPTGQLSDETPVEAGRGQLPPRRATRTTETREAIQALISTKTGGERRGFVRHELYRRRKYPSSALCMPRHQRPQGCAPLLPSWKEHDPTADQVLPSLNATESGSDLPCVTEGNCPIPAFRCPKGHVWEATDRPVCFYCPVCADSRVTPVKVERPRSKQRRNLEVIQRLAEARGGICLSTTYNGMHGKLHFRCAKGHEWYSSPSNLTYKNTWCPTCGDSQGSQRRRLTAADMRYTARQFGGEFISTEYKGANVKHEWRCHRGHHFWQTPNNVRRAEGGRRAASFCKECNARDRDVIKASVLAGYGPQEAMIAQVALEKAGAMPLRRHFTPPRKRNARAEVEKKLQRVTLTQATRALGMRSPFPAADSSPSSSNAEGDAWSRG